MAQIILRQRGFRIVQLKVQGGIIAKELKYIKNFQKFSSLEPAGQYHSNLIGTNHPWVSFFKQKSSASSKGR
jgi:hypothetical protein